jgi:hypothetical protein
LHEHFDPQEPFDAQEQPEMKSGASKMLTRGPEEPKRIAERRRYSVYLLYQYISTNTDLRAPQHDRRAPQGRDRDEGSADGSGKGDASCRDRSGALPHK